MNISENEGKTSDEIKSVDKEKTKQKDKAKSAFGLLLRFPVNFVIFLILFAFVFLFLIYPKEQYLLLLEIISGVIVLFFVIPLIVKYFFWLAFREKLKYSESLLYWFLYIITSCLIITLIIFPIAMKLELGFDSIPIILAFFAFPFVALLAIFIFKTIKKLLKKES